MEVMRKARELRALRDSCRACRLLLSEEFFPERMISAFFTMRMMEMSMSADTSLRLKKWQ